MVLKIRSAIRKDIIYANVLGSVRPFRRFLNPDEPRTFLITLSLPLIVQLVKSPSYVLPMTLLQRSLHETLNGSTGSVWFWRI